jgi:hypothetical protein
MQGVRTQDGAGGSVTRRRGSHARQPSLLVADWRAIDTAPDAFHDPKGAQPLRLRDAEAGVETVGKQSYVNDSGWRDADRREFWPTHWAPL